MSGSDVPSYAQLLGLIEQLRSENAKLVERVTELEARLAQNSKNSSKPPSSDGLAKPAPKSRRGRSGRKPGGQSGHPGRTLEQVEAPDEVRRHEPAACGGCGGDLAGAAQTGVVRRQVFDIPQAPVRVVEHQLIGRRCGCGVTTCGRAPDGVDAPVQYGARITAILIYLYVGQFLSKQRTAQALGELFGVPISAGTVAAASSRAARDITDSGFLDRVRDLVVASPVAHFDETGFRVAGRLHWVHSASTGKYSLITVHAKRGTAAMDAAGVLPAFTGIAVHDAWAPYDTYAQAGHALCGAHVLRELTAVIDTTPTGYCWARQAHDALLGLKKLVDDTVEAGTPSSTPKPSPTTPTCCAQRRTSVPPATVTAAASWRRSITRWRDVSSTGKPTTCASPPTSASPSTTTPRNAKSG